MGKALLATVFKKAPDTFVARRPRRSREQSGL
jgi:hypothetical protein